jgi:hypothetical protein
MSVAKSKRKKLRIALAARGIFSIADFARTIPCRRETIYAALERPEVFPRVTREINHVLEPNGSK